MVSHLPLLPFSSLRHSVVPSPPPADLALFSPKQEPLVEGNYVAEEAVVIPVPMEVEATCSVEDRKFASVFSPPLPPPPRHVQLFLLPSLSSRLSGELVLLITFVDAFLFVMPLFWALVLMLQIKPLRRNIFQIWEKKLQTFKCLLGH